MKIERNHLDLIEMKTNTGKIDLIFFLPLFITLGSSFPSYHTKLAVGYANTPY